MLFTFRELYMMCKQKKPQILTVTVWVTRCILQKCILPDDLELTHQGTSPNSIRNHNKRLFVTEDTLSAQVIQGKTQSKPNERNNT